MRTKALALFVCMLSFTASPAFAAEEEVLSPYQWQQQQKTAFDQSEKIYADALKRNGLLAQYKAMRDAYRANKNRAFRIVFGQYMSWYQTFVGDYPAAHDSYSIRQQAASDDASSPLIGGYTAKPALDAVAKLAKGRKAIFFNEAHNVPLTRTLTVELLSKLRAEGYNYFAAETLYESDPDLQKRGYPIPNSGFYTMEPICAEMTRTAIKLGFKIVAYESEPPGNGDIRENTQAKNLYERVFAHDPTARVVVSAGYAHIQENGRYLGGSSMAQHFRKLSGIDPLTVEQTMLIEHPPGTENHPYYRAVMDSLHPTTPIIFVSKDGTPWTLKPKAYDVSVFFPPDDVRDGRPTWLALGGLRVPYFVSGSQCKNEYPCLIEARYEKEGDDAIPADRLVLDPTHGAEELEDRLTKGHAITHASLYLRPGKYRLTGINQENSVLYHQDIVVDNSTPKAQTSGRQSRQSNCTALLGATNGGGLACSPAESKHD